MPFLLLREDSKTSLSALVDRGQKKSPPLLEYDLQLNNGHLDLVLLSKPDRKTNSASNDEGFESDIDSQSIVSNDSFSPENGKIETDSANGSSSSDSDTEVSLNKHQHEHEQPQIDGTKESFDLVDCVCYTDVSFNDILIFVIRTEALVFKFDDIPHLKTFYTNFTTLKAVANQKVYSGASFNVLRDRNGLVHLDLEDEPKPRSANLKYNTINSKLGPEAEGLSKSGSIENILDVERKAGALAGRDELRKVWNSAENLLEPPKRPERRKKGKAPQPPPPTTDVFKGQYVRVNVTYDLAKRRLALANEPRARFVAEPELEAKWGGPVPGRRRPPMAYRYIDTTTTTTTRDPPRTYCAVSRNPLISPRPNIGNRLFGLSAKLREFSCGGREEGGKWEAAGSGSSLKSVIKSDREESRCARKKNEKKVTFSAYTTVQVV